MEKIVIPKDVQFDKKLYWMVSLVIFSNNLELWLSWSHPILWCFNRGCIIIGFYFNKKIRVNEFTTHATSDNGNDSYIKVKIPKFARSEPIRVITPYGEATHEQRAGGASVQPNINTSDIP